MYVSFIFPADVVGATILVKVNDRVRAQNAGDNGTNMYVDRSRIILQSPLDPRYVFQAGG